MCLYNTSFPLQSVIVAVGIGEPNPLCAFSSPSFRFPFFSFLNIFPEQFSPQALVRVEKCREERETDWQRQRERAREEEREAEDDKAISLKGSLVQSLNKDKRKLNSEGAQPRCLGELGEHRAGKRSDVEGQPTQGGEEIHVGGRRHRMEAGAGWAGWPCTPSVGRVNLRTRCERCPHRGAARPCLSKPKRGAEGTHVAVGDGLDAESQSAKNITEHLRRSREGRWTWKWVSARLDLKQQTECTTNQICLLGWNPCSNCHDTTSSYDVNTCLQHWILWSSTFYIISTQEMSLRKQGMFLS